MNTKKQEIKNVPTNIITGFLGAGKTTAILHLLKQKPVDERWAVLVNEFGEIGVDGSLVQGQHAQDQAVFIREVPGGCMCCTAGLSMQVALNQLLTQAKPTRLLIEPTGLGHPKEVLQILSTDPYQDILSLQKTLTLVDARKLSDRRYTTHETFNQQIAIADIVIGNKLDLYQKEDKERLQDYVKKQASEGTQLAFSQQGAISLSWLEGNTTSTEFYHHHHSHHHHHPAEAKPSLSDMPIPTDGHIKASNQGEGVYSTGWRFAPNQLFQYNALFSFLSSLTVERMKAVFITEKGIFGYNLTTDDLTEIELDDCMESRIELISSEINNTWEKQLMACLVT
jgi:G3E family GTPase